MFTDVFTLQDNYANSAEPTESMTFTQWGLTAYTVEYWSGSSWIQIPNASVTGNNKIWRKFEFSPISTSKIRVVTISSVDGYSRLTEVEAYGPADTGGSGNGVHWLVPDHLGTPRIILDQIGRLEGVTRHDNLPFGEELFAGTGARTVAMGYSADSVRQQFTAKERNNETGLDYFLARYYSTSQGRFTSPDPTLLSANGHNPQTWNRYSYVMNDPLAYVDPLGLWALDFETVYKKDKDGNEILDKKGQRIVDHVTVTAVKTQRDDDAASLADQLGLEGGDAKDFIKKVGNGDNIRLSKAGGEVGRIYNIVEPYRRSRRSMQRRVKRMDLQS